RGAGEIINLVDFDIERKADIVSNELESGVRHEARHIRPRCCEEVVHAEDLVPAGEQSLTQMGAYESGASCDKNAAVAEHLFASPLSRVMTSWRPPTGQTRRAIYTRRAVARKC